MIKISQAYDCDVLVVGAGPAGSASAAHLAASGFQVMLLDQHHFPRDKICGDFVGPVGLLELSRLGIPEQTIEQQTNIINYASAFLDNRELVSATIPEITGYPTHGRVIPRLLLDNWVFQKAADAGVEIREGYRVTAIHKDKFGVTVTARANKQTFYFRTRLLIGADGSNSVIARAVRGFSPPAKDRIVAVRAYFEDVEGPQDRADLYFTKTSFPGYCWLFPTGEGRANVGVGMAAKMIPPGKLGLKSLLLNLVKTDKALHQRLANAQLTSKINGWPLTTYDHRLPVTSDRIMLVGDAAGLINPLNGEGIQYALLSGRWAAEAAGNLLADDNLGQTALSIYARKLEQELRYDMAVSSLIVQVIRNRNLNPVWLQALDIIGAAARQEPEYTSIAGGVLAGLLPANDLLGYRVIWGTLRQAAISLGVDPIVNSVSHPVTAIHNGFDIARSGVSIVFSSLRHYRESMEWGLDVANGGTELAANVYQELTTKYGNVDKTKYPAQSYTK